MNINEVTLSENTLSNLKAVEYQWVRSMYVEGYGDGEINHYIKACFGGMTRLPICFDAWHSHKKAFTFYCNTLVVPLQAASFK